MSTEPVRSFDELHIGRTYIAKADPGTGEVFLELVCRRGRPPALTGSQLKAARALSRIGYPNTHIAGCLGVSAPAVSTALGTRRAS